jgi:hypothetical protein
MGVTIDHSLTLEDLGVAMWALDIAPRFGLTFHWSDGVKVRGWSVLAPTERAPFEACRPAIRALLTPDASGRAGLDYIKHLGPPPEQAILKPSLADKIAAAALDHRGDPNAREIAWRKLHQFGALRPIEPRLPPPAPAPKPAPDYSQPGWRSTWRPKQERPAWTPPPPKPKQPPPRGCRDWTEGWSYFRNIANWFGDKGNRRTTMFGFRASVFAEPPRDKWAPPRWGWFAEAPDGRTSSGKGQRTEIGAMGDAWAWLRSVWPSV